MAVEFRSEHFDPRVIMESGQCFRMVPLDANSVEVIASGRCVALTSLGDNRFALDCAPVTFDTFWRDYFDLDTDYAAIVQAIPAGDTFLADAVAREHGLRILRQEPWETLCGFILSQRKNIKAIRACMEALSDAYGEPVEGTARKTFPTPQRLAALNKEPLCACGLGYRAPYVMDAARRIAEGELQLDALATLPDEALFEALTRIHGVGVKIADCVMLFAFRRFARAPVDVWIKRVIDIVYGGVSPYPGYGPYAGIYQQYQFMYSRDGGLSAWEKA